MAYEASSSSSGSASSSSSASSSAGDSYVGSVISLTSKCEIRYEGVLVTINTQESTIALQNVRSYGTEGRKKDGPQIPPSDKVYEYILFRGSDIKDLQVKSSPPVFTKPQLPNDPAIIQSQYGHTPSTSTNSAPVGGGTLTDLSSHSGHLVKPIVPDALSLYQTGTHLGSWVPSPAPPNSTAASLPRPMYWQGYVGASGLTHGQQQSIPFQPPSSVPVPLTLQNQLQYPEGNASLNAMPNFSELANPLIFSSSVAPQQFATTNSANVSSTLPSNTSLRSHPSSSLPSDLVTMSSFGSSNQELMGIANPISSKVGSAPVSVFPFPSLPYSSSYTTSSSLGSVTAVPHLLTPDQLTQSGPMTPSSTQNFFPERKDEEALLPLSSNPPPSVCDLSSQAPLLPLPRPSQQYHRGGAQFTEEFDFTAMNEKFNKDEVWGSLGKAKQGGKLGDGTEDDLLHGSVEVEEGYDKATKFDSKPVYNKDDFFDTLSCNSLNRGAWSGRTKFSQRMKLDTETFGDFQPRPPLARGSPGAAHAGNFRGSYNRGRGYGYYSGRGRGGYRPI